MSHDPIKSLWVWSIWQLGSAEQWMVSVTFQTTPFPSRLPKLRKWFPKLLKWGTWVQFHNTWFHDSNTLWTLIRRKLSQIWEYGKSKSKLFYIKWQDKITCTTVQSRSAGPSGLKTLHDDQFEWLQCCIDSSPIFSKLTNIRLSTLKWKGSILRFSGFWWHQSLKTKMTGPIFKGYQSCWIWVDRSKTLQELQMLTSAILDCHSTIRFKQLSEMSKVDKSLLFRP